MTKHLFYKYQGTGNDFVILDQRDDKWINHHDKEKIRKICDRRFGVGGDGLILLEEDPMYDFKMVYFNSDGNESSMCGNGGRCIVAFANKLGILSDKCVFSAIDGLHEARIINGKVELKMQDVDDLSQSGDVFILNTGSPHYVHFVSRLEDYDIIEEGKRVRYSETYKEEGINVNLVERKDDGIKVETYERGVEWETLSCGTGVTACALSYGIFSDLKDGTQQVKIETKGGDLEVRYSFNKDKKTFSEVWLIGPAEFVFEGTLRR